MNLNSMKMLNEKWKKQLQDYQKKEKKNTSQKKAQDVNKPTLWAEHFQFLFLALPL